MHTPQSTCKSSWKIFPLGYRIEYQIAWRCSPIMLSMIVDTLVSNVLPQEIFKKEKLHDRKGGPGLVRGHAADLRTRDQLFAFEGSLCSEDITHDVSAQITTPFDSFQGHRHILHTSAITISPELTELASPETALKALGTTAALTPQKVSYTEEYFTPARFMIFGYTPAVRKSIALHADYDTCCCTMIIEGAETSDVVEITGHAVFSAVLELCGRFGKST
jgi:hypothetical protein